MAALLVAKVYCAMRELVCAIGREKVVDMFFGARAARHFAREG